jgi:hypothetical protein
VPKKIQTIWDVFLSHSHEDAESVEFVAKRLEDDGRFTVWLDKWVLIPGKSWQRDIAKGLNETSCCAAFIGGKTPDGWFRMEIERAIDRQATDDRFRVLAVLLPGADEKYVDQFLGLRSWVDFREGLDNKKEFHRFFSAIRDVAPGRGPAKKTITSEQMNTVKEDLSKIKQLLDDRLIAEEIAYEYQRKLLDSLVSV